MKPEVESCPECGAVLTDPNDHSDPARRRYFAIIRDVWDNLTDNWRPLFPSSEHLRKFVLCKIGWCDVSVTNCGSARAAIEVSGLAKRLDTFAVIDIRGPIVTVMTARSIRKRGCPKAVFMPLTEKSYAYLNEMTGTDVEASSAPAHTHGEAA